MIFYDENKVDEMDGDFTKKCLNFGVAKGKTHAMSHTNDVVNT